MNKGIKLLTLYFRVNLAIMIGIFLLSGLVFFFFVDYVIITEVDGELEGIQQSIVAYVQQNKALPQWRSFNEEQVEFTPTDSLAAESSSRLVKRYSRREKKMHNFRERVFPLRFDNHYYKVTVLKPLGGLHHMQRIFLWGGLVTIVAITVILSFVNNIVFKKLWQPFYHAITQLAGFNIGKNKQLHFPKTNVIEFATLNESIQTAAEKAEQDYRLLKEFTENASHEIQTPLSIIRSKLDLLIQDKDLSVHQGELVKGIYMPVKKLSKLNRSLLLLTKIENQQFCTTERIDLKARLEEKLEQFGELLRMHRIQLCETLNASFIQANSELVDILFNNLLSNAINHNYANGSIDIMLKEHSFVISNTGDPQPLDNVRVFTRFYKNLKRPEFNGLGLSIVKQICEVSNITPAYSFANDRHVFSLQWNIPAQF